MASQVADAAIRRNPTFSELAALPHYGWSSLYNTYACHMEDVGTCCSSCCYINHCCVALPQGGREIPSITWSDYACLSNRFVVLFWCRAQRWDSTRSDVTLSIVLFFEHILCVRCPWRANNMIYAKLPVRKTCIYGCTVVACLWGWRQIRTAITFNLTSRIMYFVFSTLYWLSAVSVYCYLPRD